MFLFPLLILILIVWLFVFLANNISGSSFSSQHQQIDRSLEILKERYARGEINEDEFVKMKRNLQ